MEHGKWSCRCCYHHHCCRMKIKYWLFTRVLTYWGSEQWSVCMYEGKKFVMECLRKFLRRGQKLSMHWRDLPSELAPTQVIVALYEVLRVLGGLYNLSKFGWNLIGSFYNMKVLICCPFGWEMPNHTPKIEVFGRFDPLNGELYQHNLQKAYPCMGTRRMMYRSSKSVHWWNLCVWLRN